MQVHEHEIAYEVTVSKELRALLRARGSQERDNVVSSDMQADPPCPPSLSEAHRVFSEVKLRSDGRRPLRLSAGEIFHIGCTDALQAEGGHSEMHGGVSVTLYCTRDGDCVAHVVSEPPEGSSLRPVYRSYEVRSAADVHALLSGIQQPVSGSSVIAQECATSDQINKAMLAHTDRYNRMMKQLEPFLEFSRN